MEDLRAQLGNVEFVDGGKGSTGSRSGRDKGTDEETRLKRSTSQDK